MNAADPASGEGVAERAAVRVTAKALHEQWFHDGDECLHPEHCERDATALQDAEVAVTALASAGLLAAPSGEGAAIKTPRGEVAPGIKEPRRACTPSPADLTEQGRRLASQRDDLIAQGVDPSDLAVPIAARAGAADPLRQAVEADRVIDAIEETFLANLPSKALSYCAHEDVVAGLDAMRERFQTPQWQEGERP